MTKLKLSATELPYLDSADLFAGVADEPWALFFDSGVNGKNTRGDAEQQSDNPSVGRYDILAIRPQATLVFDGQVTEFITDDKTRRLYGDPLAILQAAVPACKRVKSNTYVPGAYGYLSYDLARQYESIPTLAADDQRLPQMAMGVYYVVLVVDHRRRKSRIVRMGNAPHAMALEQYWLDLVLRYQDDLVAREIDAMDQQRDLRFAAESPNLAGSELRQSLNWRQYQTAFESVRDYTERGDCYQVNLTKRFSSPVSANAWLAYAHLRVHSPAPYGCFMNLPFAQVLSNSPESFIQCRNRNVITSPIKGTRARDHANPAADRATAISLQNSAKDRAENLMIVDLMRNDLSRSCELGSVKVPELFSLQSFANVHHLISRVEGRLRKDLHVIDLLRSCFPGGSITGAPKIRAMEIIEELEPQRRGLYCGAIAYVGANGDLETNIAIRTIVVKDGVAYFSAGGGLVIDSEVNDEYQELNDKVSMLMAAVMAEKGALS